MVTITNPEHLKARAAMLGEEADRWKKHHAEAFAKLAVGTEVIIDLTTGEYVTGATWQAAEAAFVQRFGSEDRLSHTFTVGRPTFIGGGLWLK